tara:strand:+ start:476 stop:1033 length:558 start_codon:yes stop_codon:yes gene_type:complete
MNLFELDSSNVVVFSPQALLIAPFKKIWDADKTKDKKNAMRALSYIYYMSDDRSDYMYLLDEEERSDVVKQALQLPASWKGNTKDLVRARHYYEEMSATTSTKLLKSTRLVVQKISSFLDNIDMDERDDRSKKPVHDISKITASVQKIPSLIKALNEIEKEVVKEKALKSQSGNKEMSMFDDGGI